MPARLAFPFIYDYIVACLPADNPVARLRIDALLGDPVAKLELTARERELEALRVEAAARAERERADAVEASGFEVG